MATTRDELAGILRASHRAPIVEADEWRQLAEHVLELHERGLLESPRDEAFALMENVLREIEFGVQAYDDICPLCKRVHSKGHRGWCRLGRALQRAEEVHQRNREARNTETAGHR